MKKSLVVIEAVFLMLCMAISAMYLLFGHTDDTAFGKWILRCMFYVPVCVSGALVGLIKRRKAFDDNLIYANALLCVMQLFPFAGNIGYIRAYGMLSVGLALLHTAIAVMGVWVCVVTARTLVVNQSNSLSASRRQRMISRLQVAFIVLCAVTAIYYIKIGMDSKGYVVAFGLCELLMVILCLIAFIVSAAKRRTAVYKSLLSAYALLFVMQFFPLFGSIILTGFYPFALIHIALHLFVLAPCAGLFVLVRRRSVTESNMGGIQ